MRAVLQRVTSASVSVDAEVVGRIDEPGLVVLLGVTHADGSEQVAWMVRKIRDTRIMRDEASVQASVPRCWWSASSRCTATHARAGARPGRRPRPVRCQSRSTTLSATVCVTAGTHVETGVFGAEMSVALVNDGPFTVLLEQ